MSTREFVIYKDIKYFIQSSGHYYQCARKDIKPRLLHRKVWFDNYGEIPAGHIIHHRDHNWRNNDISNLEMVERGKHSSDHMKKFLQDPEYIRKTRAGLAKGQEYAKAWHSSAEGIKWHKMHGKKSWDGRKVEAIACSVCGKIKETPFPSRTRFCSSACAQRIGYKRYETDKRKCVQCGVEFVTNKHRDIKTCGYKCSAIRRWALIKQS